MLNSKRLCWMLVLALGAQLPASAQFPFTKKKETEAVKEAKNQAKYEKLKQYSLDRYQSDPDFREEVDDAYEALLRDHSERAYQRNISVSSNIRTVREDRWREHLSLYDNLLVQDQINRIGQRMAPPESEHAFAFRVIPEPTPVAETLATGTVYVSTGLISLLDSEAQLAYVLAHEAGHVQLGHWKERVMLEHGQKAYAEDQAKKAATFTAITGLLGAGLGAGIGQSVGSALLGGGAGVLAGLIGSAIIDRPLVVAWDRVQEDAADDYAMKAVLGASYDVREVPALYVAMQKAVLRDTRVGLGFLGSRQRVEQRLEKSRDLIANAMKADIEVKLKSGFLSTSAEHRNLMAELKRDNGIMAYYHDMFDLARANLQEAVAIRGNDPSAHYYYAKVLKLTGRTDEDAKMAQDEFYKAAKADVHDENFGAHLHLALMMARDRSPDTKQISDELDAYVTDYARMNATQRAFRGFPPNLETIYEYMTLYGKPDWTPKAPNVQDLPAYQLLNALLGDEVRQEAARPAAPLAAPEAPKPAAPAKPQILPIKK